MRKRIYAFGGGAAEGNRDMKELLGGKGAGLAEMSAIGIPVPPGFTITTEVCTSYYANKQQYPKELQAQVATALARIEKLVGAKFGSTDRPLLVSVRSGARASMPGIEARAPERTDTKSGLLLSPKVFPARRPTAASALTTWARSSFGYCWPLA